MQAIKREGNQQNSVHRKVCESVYHRLGHDVQQATKMLRAQQKSFVDQRKQFQQTEKASFLQLAADHVLNNGNALLDMDELIEDEAMKDLQSRNEEVRKIVQSIYQLNEIYKNLGDLVLMQGSLLDRIDQNIEVSFNLVTSGRQHLQKVFDQ